MPFPRASQALPGFTVVDLTSTGIQVAQPLCQTDGIIVAEFGGQGEHDLKA